MAVNFAMLFAARVGTADRRSRRQPAVALAHLGLLSEAQARHGVFDLRAGRPDRHLARRRGRRLGHAAPRLARDVLTGRVPGHLPRAARAADGHRAAARLRRLRRAGRRRRRRRARAVEVLSLPVRQRPSFRHLSLAAALHSVVWYAGGAFNNAFLQRSHQMTASQAGYWISLFSAIGGVGTFLGGYRGRPAEHAAERSPLVYVGARHRDAGLRAVSVRRVPVAGSARSCCRCSAR